MQQVFGGSEVMLVSPSFTCIFKYIPRLSKGFFEAARGQITNLTFKQFSFYLVQH